MEIYCDISKAEFLHGKIWFGIFRKWGKVKIYVLVLTFVHTYKYIGSTHTTQMYVLSALIVRTLFNCLFLYLNLPTPHKLHNHNHFYERQLHFIKQKTVLLSYIPTRFTDYFGSNQGFPEKA
jgi:hypothetical protein